MLTNSVFTFVVPKTCSLHCLLGVRNMTNTLTNSSYQQITFQKGQVVEFYLENTTKTRCVLREKRLLRPGPRKLEMSVCPSVRPFVRPRFTRFLRRAYGPRTPSDPLRKTSTFVWRNKTRKAWHVCYLLCANFDDHFFDQKQCFYQKSTIVC